MSISGRLMRYLYSISLAAVLGLFVADIIPPFEDYFKVASQSDRYTITNLLQIKKQYVGFGGLYKYDRIRGGSVAEWLKAHDSKSCGQKCLGGSNPFASARLILKRTRYWVLFLVSSSL